MPGEQSANGEGTSSMIMLLDGACTHGEWCALGKVHALMGRARTGLHACMGSAEENTVHAAA